MSKKKIALFGVLGLLFLCVVVGIISVLSGGGDRTAGSSSSATRTPRPTATMRATSAPAPTRTPVPTATPKPISSLAYEDMRKARDSMTDAQWDAHAKTLVGQRVEWSGWVFEAKTSGELRIDMDPPGTFLSVQDCYISVPRDSVLDYNKDQPIRWQGDVRSVTSLLGSVSVRFEDVVILP